MLTSLDNMGNQVIALQTQAVATATALANTAKISKLLTDPGQFDGSMAKLNGGPRSKHGKQRAIMPCPPIQTSQSAQYCLAYKDPKLEALPECA